MEVVEGRGERDAKGWKLKAVSSRKDLKFVCTVNVGSLAGVRGQLD
jgi:hypothetical protein